MKIIVGIIDAKKTTIERNNDACIIIEAQNGERDIHF